MIWILSLIFFVGILLHAEPFWRLNTLLAQSYCVQWTVDHNLIPIFAGLICGKSLPQNEQGLFLNLGIYHWLVASGGHLVFIQYLLDWGAVKQTGLRCLLLLLYTLICGLQPPIVRAYISLILLVISNQQGLFLTRQQRNLNSGLLCLCIFPDWLQSFSFQLSWMASLAIDPKKSTIFQAFNISIFLWPLSVSWSPLHLIYNILLTPIFSFFLFPLSLFFFLFAPLIPLGNLFWQTVCKILQLLPSDNSGLIRSESPTTVWIYIFVLQTALLFFERLKK